MTRDDDFIREILFEMEKEESYHYLVPGRQTDPSLEEERKVYHCLLMADQGLITTIGDNKFLFRLTNVGHDFLADIKDDDIWSATKDTARKVGAGSLSLLAEIAKALAKQKISEATGLTF